MFTGAVQLAAIIKTFWAEKYFETLRDNLVFIECVNQDYQQDMQEMGDTVKISQFPDFDEAELLPAGGSADDVDVTITSQSLVANKRPALDVSIDNMGRLQSMSFMDQLQNAVTFSIMKRANREVLNTIVPSTSSPDHQVSYATASTLTFPDYLTAQELLNTQNVSLDNRFVIVGAAGYSDMFNIAEFTSRDFNGGEATVNNGTFGRPFMGFTPRFSNMVGATTLFFQRTCVAVAFQKALNSEVASGAYTGARANRINTDIIMATKQLDSKRSVRFD